MERLKSNFLFLVAGVVVIAITAKIIQYNLLPAKYFYDSDRILWIMGGSPALLPQESYILSALFSKTINLFNLSSLLQWSIFYACIFNPIIINLLNKLKIEAIVDYILMLVLVGLLNLYVFNLSKDIFQFCVFLCIYVVISSNTSITKKLFLSVAILFLWGMLFRIYYILIAVYSLWCYLCIKNKKKKSLMFSFIVTITGVFLSLLFAYLFLRDEYTTIIYIHDRLNLRREGSEDAITMINDVFISRGNLFIYMVNYIINLARMMLPFELILKMDLKYLLFFTYQMVVTTFTVRRAKLIFKGESKDEQIVAFSIYVGFLLGSALFEADFGSWTRHETAASPIMLIILFDARRDISLKNAKQYIPSRYIRNYRETKLDRRNLKSIDA